MKRHVDITLTLSLLLDATLGEGDIVTHVRSALPLAFGGELTARKNPVDILEVREKASIDGDPPPRTARTLPADPDDSNDDRACWAGRAVHVFRGATGTDREDALCDLLADLMHWADRNGFDFQAELARGRGHYEAETAEVEVAP